MAYNETLANRIREYLMEQPDIAEKEMMGGLVFMINGKMCVGVLKDDLMCRIDPEMHDDAVEKQGCRTMDFTKKPMRGYILIEDYGMHTQKDFAYWIDLALAFNPMAQASKKKSK